MCAYIHAWPWPLSCRNIHVKVEIHEHPWLALPKDNVPKYIHNDQIKSLKHFWVYMHSDTLSDNYALLYGWSTDIQLFISQYSQGRMHFWYFIYAHHQYKFVSVNVKYILCFGRYCNNGSAYVGTAHSIHYTCHDTAASWHVRHMANYAQSTLLHRQDRQTV